MLNVCQADLITGVINLDIEQFKLFKCHCHSDCHVCKDNVQCFKLFSSNTFSQTLTFMNILSFNMSLHEYIQLIIKSRKQLSCLSMLLQFKKKTLSEFIASFSC